MRTSKTEFLKFCAFWKLRWFDFQEVNTLIFLKKTAFMIIVSGTSDFENQEASTLRSVSFPNNALLRT